MHFPISPEIGEITNKIWHRVHFGWFQRHCVCSCYHLMNRLQSLRIFHGRAASLVYRLHSSTSTELEAVLSFRLTKRSVNNRCPELVAEYPERFVDLYVVALAL